MAQTQTLITAIHKAVEIGAANTTKALLQTLKEQEGSRFGKIEQQRLAKTLVSTVTASAKRAQDPQGAQILGKWAQSYAENSVLTRVVHDYQLQETFNKTTLAQECGQYTETLQAIEQELNAPVAPTYHLDHTIKTVAPTMKTSA